MLSSRVADVVSGEQPIVPVFHRSESSLVFVMEKVVYGVCGDSKDGGRPQWATEVEGRGVSSVKIVKQVYC